MGTRVNINEERTKETRCKSSGPRLRRLVRSTKAPLDNSPVKQSETSECLRKARLSLLLGSLPNQLFLLSDVRSGERTTKAMLSVAPSFLTHPHPWVLTNSNNHLNTVYPVNTLNAIHVRILVHISQVSGVFLKSQCQCSLLFDTLMKVLMPCRN